ncbi:hypothetical protein JCM21531_3559 [Acetivibrio straminisolvens JCM 21531]|uniref:Uncharacterized protein n=1 Tax=Acetivibrio straminisolvens JCM 21531 TaxID=1294263 RepID=W4VB11_9FIRM|nr:hypothetical protein JCM21531_3559 [Acetivibrio straminisolvens JCM 21531]
MFFLIVTTSLYVPFLINITVFFELFDGIESIASCIVLKLPVLSLATIISALTAEKDTSGMLFVSKTVRQRLMHSNRNIFLLFFIFFSSIYYFYIFYF